MKRKSKPLVCYVEWHDAMHIGSGTYDRKEINPDARFVVHTSGWLIAKSRKSIVIAQDFSDEGTDGVRRYRDIDHIPRAMVRKMRTWRV